MYNIQDDRENVYGLSAIPYQPSYKDQENRLRAPRQQKQPPASAQTATQERRTPPMPKARAMTLARKLKRWVVVSSLVSMGAFGGLIMTHLSTSTTSSQTTQTGSSSSSTTATKSSSSSTTTQAQPTATSTTTSSQGTTSSSSSTSGSFLQQQGGDQFGSTSSSQQPVTSTHASR
jgi:hypothetical protein